LYRHPAVETIPPVASENAQARRLLQRDQDRYETHRKFYLGKNEWRETTLIYRRKEDAEHDDHRQYSMFVSNYGSGHLTEYGYRLEIESCYRSIKRFVAATTAKNFGLGFFYSYAPVWSTRSGERWICSNRSS
jgi:hypothetical protein